MHAFTKKAYKYLVLTYLSNLIMFFVLPEKTA